MTKPRKLHTDPRGLHEVVLALARCPRADRDAIAAALARIGADPGWHEEVRGLALVLCGSLADLRDGTTLRRALDALDGMDDKGTLGWVVERFGGDLGDVS